MQHRYSRHHYSLAHVCGIRGGLRFAIPMEIANSGIANREDSHNFYRCLQIIATRACACTNIVIIRTVLEVCSLDSPPGYWKVTLIINVTKLHQCMKRHSIHA